MSDETTHLILGDAALDATGQPPRRRRFFRKRGPELPLTHCENCRAALTGNYCAQCGQHAIDYRRSLLRVLVDAADSFFNWDTRFLKSIAILLTRPWRLTNDFNAGRRVRHVHPLRLYLLASIAFFLIVKMIPLNPGSAIRFGASDRAQIDAGLAKLAATDSALTAQDRARIEEARAKIGHGQEPVTGQQKREMAKAMATLLSIGMKENFKEKDHAKAMKALDRLSDAVAEPTPAATPSASPSASPDASPSPVVPSPSLASKMQLSADFSPSDNSGSDFEQWMESRIKRKIGEDGSKGRLFFDTLRNNIPTMMLCCIPLFALVLKVIYFRQHRFYVEHLVYALHIHSFFYLGVTIIALIGLGLTKWSVSVSAPILTLLSCILLWQVIFSIRRVYRQGWFFTLFKFTFGGCIYLVILSLGIGATAFVTLLLPG
ncbi:MAG: DUF3667 domain-containing protein [Verrucomicrobiota bacterium]|nr:DUF3667 domain-containing protein [Verrucomicrobiota bacterium]